ncbi:MAG: hypothetical protein HN778_02360 [Prolixibacteraceae bacterium]|jgi:hypothetical protein|nr:hypothetical protein [Prolixibacteraceae bacterium]MBT6005911.1 hypothetical protein [Prolixibacteraceae bacterium]MBT6762957.1 hypothetical protein [Prolixibacteraceae bacterium]MBT7000226.1 hypothetical protein [Prolixibacteraceae bacterium]MBT7393654.1 hypothetical protein [Prolixibacteraceae bacterium]
MKLEIKRIRELLKAERQRLNTHLLNENNEAVVESLKKIDLAEKVFAQYSFKIKRIISTVILLAAFVVISFLYLQKIPTSNILLNTVNNGFSVHLTNNWKSNDMLSCTKIVMDNIKTMVVLPDFKLYNNVANFTLNSEKIGLDKIEFFDANWLHFDRYGKSGLMVIVDTGFVKCTFKVKNGEYSVNNKNYSIKKDEEFGFPSTIQLTTDIVSKSSGPFIFRFLGVSSLAFNIIDFDSIRFEKPDYIEKGKFRSTIVSGDLLLTETSQTKDLNSWNKVLLVNKSANSFTSDFDGLNIKSGYNGSAKKIISFTGNHKEKLKPSILEYLYYNKPLAILWSSILLLISILWSLKNTLIR